MDTITQGLLGAACGQALYAKALGRRAVLWGAVGGLIPDLDMAVIPLLGPLAEFRYHRSATHSLAFGPLVGVVLGYLAYRLAGRRHGTAGAGAVSAWIGLYVVSLVTHPLLDLFTTYGTQLLWPLSHRRFALDAVAILDPFYSILLVAALWMGHAKRERPALGSRSAWAALGLSTAYLFYGLLLNQQAEGLAHRQLAREGSVGAQLRSYPTLLQPWLRRIVVREPAPGEVGVGFLSLLRPGNIGWQRFKPAQGPLAAALRETPEGRLFEWFAMGETAARQTETATGTLVEIEDLRYGYGERPDEGLWGIRGRFDGERRPLGGVERFTRQPRGVARALGLLWRSTFGP
ncbi:MAG TPA: metal-dependent hydrolase [Vicinamibacteria bacterium]|nr:metal-dependent hydrolase [Vicinamibacteria bacterium]